VTVTRERPGRGASPRHPRFPVQAAIASATLGALAKAEKGAALLSRLVEFDPALTLSVMRQANAPHLGHSRRVGSARQAMVLLGTKAVNGLTTSGTAALVLNEDDATTPAGFWMRSLTTAVASANIARRVGSSADEAFSAGILTELGDVLLRSRQPRVHAEVRAELGVVHDRRTLDAELHELGRTHTDAAADQLEQWWFPDRVVRAVRFHHERPEALTETLPRVVRCGTAVMTLLHRHGPGDAAMVNEAFAVFGIGALRPDSVAAEVENEVLAIAHEVTKPR
jgi:HD-like signal output (HDOD) protein